MLVVIFGKSTSFKRSGDLKSLRTLAVESRLGFYLPQTDKAPKNHPLRPSSLPKFPVSAMVSPDPGLDTARGIMGLSTSSHTVTRLLSSLQHFKSSEVISSL